MRTRVLVVSAALAFAGACAHGSTKSDTVSDEVLARVPAEQMASVNQVRADVAKAKDTLARENLRLNKAKTYVDVAKSETDVAKAQQDRDHATQKAADYARNDQASTKSQTAMGVSLQREQVANAHVKAATELVNYAQERVTAAQKAVDLANARLELAKFKAVQASGDPAAGSLDGPAIQKRVDDNRIALEQERTKVAQAKTSASAARSSWVTLRDQLPADQRSGVGGAGNSGGQPGKENYDIDTKNTDPNQGRLSTDPSHYDDKELFNLL